MMENKIKAEKVIAQMIRSELEDSTDLEDAKSRVDGVIFLLEFFDYAWLVQPQVSSLLLADPMKSN